MTNSGRILVVDDNPTNLEVICDTLIEAGYSVATAIDGERAIKRAQSNPPNLILLDIQMPGLDGFATCEQIKNNPQTAHIPIIFITAHTDIESKERGFEVGGVDYITKPFHEREVLVRVKTHMALHLLQQELQHANLELERLANLDGLTQLANRRRFDQYLNQEWQRGCRSRLPLSLILCDVDFFKPYNDTYGHLAGDECLRRIADLLKSSARRGGDLVARYGGEEFALILPYATSVEAIQVAQGIQTTIKQLQQVHVSSPICPYVTLSFGIATMTPDPHSHWSYLINQADCALYQAKTAGRDRIICCPELKTEV